MMYCLQNPANRGAPVVLLLNDNCDGSTAVFGPAFTAAL
jgi:hypothetical protein